MPTVPGQVAIVTGTNREIGAAIAETLARNNMAVLAHHYGEKERVAALVGRVEQDGGRIATFDADLGNVEANRALVQHAIDAFGRLDVFVANAGITQWGSFLDTEEADWDRVMSLNLKGSYFGAQAAARRMVKQGHGGRIIFSSSVTGNRALANASVYATTKAALQHMARVLAVELGKHHITVNALAIGATLNERNLAEEPDYISTWARRAPIGRVGIPQDIANAVQFLASPQADMITGHTLFVDGGWAMGGLTD